MKFYLTDGDLDLGLGVADTLPPFNHAFVYNKRSGEFVPANSVPKDLTDLITYRDCKTLDTLPPLTCGNWALAYRSGSVIDTVYYKVNSNHWNLFINLYAKDVAGAWQPISTANLAPFQACTPGLFNATFPRLPFVTSGPFKYQSTSSKTGTMTYDVTSFGITSLLGGKTVKIQFHIQDRALHVSNYVAKDDIVIH
ncbi:MAG TPA: hypothetical protein VL728_10125 [Cyclobacteriaceae bacterium]|nr:hypothetical protein [Cyclobacteriaceae bacterium]